MLAWENKNLFFFLNYVRDLRKIYFRVNKFDVESHNYHSIWEISAINCRNKTGNIPPLAFRPKVVQKTLNLFFQKGSYVNEFGGNLRLIGTPERKQEFTHWSICNPKTTKDWLLAWKLTRKNWNELLFNSSVKVEHFKNNTEQCARVVEIRLTIAALNTFRP